MSTVNVISHHEILSVFDYDHLTGILSRNGKPVGTNHSLGYLKLKYKKRTYFVHRICFFHYYGYWPIRLDHRNRNKKDNRIKNLRETCHEKNNANRGLMKSNTSGYKGVHLIKSNGRWKAQVGYDVVGTFENAIDAARAYDKFAKLKYGKSAVTNKKLGLI